MERKNAGWMTQEDERILEYIGEHGLSTPRTISRETFARVSPGHVAERLQVLADAELVARSGVRSYELTRDGQRYLAGELNAAHLPTPTRGGTA